MKNIRVVILLLIFAGITNIYGQYQKVNNQGLDIYYRVFGKGTPILILGGGPGDVSDRYTGLCELLSKKYQCILIEQRGVGKSSPIKADSTNISLALTISDFEVLRKEMGIKEWAVLGFSYGGFLASAYAYDYPASISSLILLGSMGFDLSFYNYFSDNIRSRMNSSDKELYEYWDDSVRKASDPHHSLVERIRAMMPGYFFDRKKALNVSQSIKDSDFNFELGNLLWGDIEKKCNQLLKSKTGLNKKVLIIQGRQDPLGESVPLFLARYYENSKVIFIEKCGHYSWVEQAEKVLSAINKFMENK